MEWTVCAELRSFRATRLKIVCAAVYCSYSMAVATHIFFLCCALLLFGYCAAGAAGTFVSSEKKEPIE